MAYLSIIKIFVTGANGFLGSHLTDRLLERGAEVHVLVRKSSSLRWLLGKKVHYHYGDIAAHSKGLQEGLEGAGQVFHVAGVIRARYPRTYYEVNATGTANLLETCLRVNPSVKRVVVVTSIASHGPNPNDSPMTEEDECHPLTDYGKSKRDAELIALRFRDRLPVAIVRPPAIYGPRDEQVYYFFRMLKKGVAILPGWGRRVLNLAHVQDVVTGLLLAAEHPKAPGEVFFVGEDRNYDWEEAADILARAVRRTGVIKVRVPKPLVYGIAGVAEAIIRLSGILLPVNLAYARNFLQRNWAVDISKAREVLGFQPAYPLTRGAEETATWYHNEGWL